MGHEKRSWTLVLFVIFSTSNCQCTERCFECQYAPYPRDCAKVTLCGDDEYCSVEQVVTTSGTILYNTGCMARSRCQTFGVNKRDSLVETLARSDRGTDITTCVECCSDELCNRHGCGATDIPRDERGPYCFTCDTTLDPHVCHKVTLCTEHEQCLLYSPLEFAAYPEVVYSGMCETASACEALSSAYQDSRCPPQCCTEDFCNTECGLPNMVSVTTPVPATTPVIITPSTIGVTVAANTTTNDMLTTSTAVLECDGNHFYDELSSICIRIVESPKDHEEAVAACEDYGEQLVTIDTHEKMVFIEYTLMRNSGLDLREQTYWIGLRKRDDGEPFQWQNGNQLQYTYWGGNNENNPDSQPDNRNNENCVVILGADHYMWYDDVCSSKRAFICEMTTQETPASPTTDMSTASTHQDCDTSGGYRLLQDGNTNLCIRVHVFQVHWNTARSFCNNENGDLVVLDTAMKASLVREHINDLTNHENFWIGMTDFHDDDVFEWVDDTKVDSTNGDWGKNQPDHTYGGHPQDCVALWYQDNFSWHDERCDRRYGFICERL